MGLRTSVHGPLLVMFDRREGKSWEERVFRREETEGDKAVTVWGM